MRHTWFFMVCLLVWIGALIAGIALLEGALPSAVGPILVSLLLVSALGMLGSAYRREFREWKERFA